MTEQQRNDFERWADAALYIADANGMADDTVIPTWPRGRAGDEAMENYPQLTVGAVRQAMAALSHAEGEAPHVYWVLFDATADKKFIKKSLDDGFLAFFDTEQEAFRAKARHTGTDYMRVEYYKHPAPQVAVPRGLRTWLDAVATVVNDTGMGHDEVIPTWPHYTDKDREMFAHHPPLKVGDVMELDAMLAGAPTVKDSLTVPAPQVAVPEAVVEALAGMLDIVRDSRGVAGYHQNGNIAEWDEFDEVAAAEVALSGAAPTAPAGEPDDSDICEQVELPHVLAWADGIRGDMWTEYADRITDEEARVAQAVWAAHTGEQPVSDADGLADPPLDAAYDGRVFADRVELKYGFQFQGGAIEDCYEWQQLRQCLVAMAEYVEHAPDEREIAAKALDEMAATFEALARQSPRLAAKDCRERAARLRAGKEGE